MRYGGNTSCVELRCGPHLVILDAGTGIRELGVALAAAAPLDADILFSHTHVDHIVGLPFFSPLFEPSNRFVCWAGHLAPELSLRDAICRMMSGPFFPVPIEIFRAATHYRDFRAGERLEPRPGLVVHTAPLRHPDRATGYRIEYGGKVVCYVTDTEHEPGRLDENVLRLVAGADLVIYDGMYTDEEFAAYRSWGHSTWQEGVRLCEAAGAGRLVLFHHDPSRDDAALDGLAAAAAGRRPGTLVARDGLELVP